MRINSFLFKLNLDFVLNNHELSGIFIDSRECINDSLFIAEDDSYIFDAINNGAKTIVTNKNIAYSNINVIVVADVIKVAALMYYEYYKYMLTAINFIGVIGTNGKTSISSLVYNYLEYNNINTMNIGTGRATTNSKVFIHDNTTPKLSILYKYIEHAYNNRIRYIVMEISSISVDKLRSIYIPFYILIFSNFSLDHLDYHKTMDNYFYCKCIPFIKLKSNSYAIINNDDLKATLISKYTTSRIITYSINKKSNYQASNIKTSFLNTTFDLDNISYSTKLLGSFNVYNILPVIALSHILRLPNIKPFIESTLPVKGRMELVHKRPYVIIDYAHTPYSVECAIVEALKMSKGMVYVVIGCGGNRDESKRSIIGKLLDSYNVISIITSDNPRYEDKEKIIDSITSNMKFFYRYSNRKDAIIFALKSLGEDDVLLILGKGIEDYIIENGHKYHYSDYETVEEYYK